VTLEAVVKSAPVMLTICPIGPLDGLNPIVVTLNAPLVINVPTLSVAIVTVPDVVPMLTIAIRLFSEVFIIVANTLLNEQFTVVLKSAPVNVTIVPTGPNVGANVMFVTLKGLTVVKLPTPVVILIYPLLTVAPMLTVIAFDA